ncbi:origin recognition complex, subunit 4, partial [Rhizodiscina lignyota]
DQIRKIVLEKVTRRRPMPLVGLEDEYKKVYQVAEQTITAGEGNSMLLIGARGSGKTALLNKVVKELARDNMSEFHVIRLNGFVHTDDKLALREIWRQLGREMEIEEDGSGKSYADTLAKLLALLSHPSELSGEHTDHIAKAVIFIMDEFDLFASHARQTLLYNLFDIAQSRKAPIAVFGLTTRIDVAESLEKRVKSRFSHRYVHLSLAKNVPMFQAICKSALTVHPDELSFDEKTLLAPSAPSTKKSKTAQDSEGALASWNAATDALFEDSDFLSRCITSHFHLTKSVSAALTSFHLPLALADPTTLPPKASHFIPERTTDSDNAVPASIPILLPPDSNLYLIPTLSSLALALLIAAARCTIIHDTDTLNFRIAYAEYGSLASKARIQSASSGALAVGAGTGTRVWSREVARASWEELVKLGLLIPALGGEGDRREVGEKGMVKVDVALEEILPSCPGMERVMERWCKQI